MYSLSFFLMPFWYILRDGYIPICQAPAMRCQCEMALYTTVGSLALIAGFLQFIVGYQYSMAVLTDSLHAIADGSADFLGVYIAYKVHGAMPAREKKLRLLGNKAIAVFLVVGGMVVAREAIGRWQGGEYPVSPIAAMLVGGAGFIIDALRTITLKKAREHFASDNIDGFIDHARTDAIHSLAVAIIGGAAAMAAYLPVDRVVYQHHILLLDLAASVGLSLYMIWLGYRRWYNKGCGHKCDHKH